MAQRPRILLTGWFGFLDGEATAGDVLALYRMRELLEGAGLDHDIGWSPGFRPAGPHLAQARPEDYSHLVFVCGPLHGPQIEELHRRFAHCVRIAVGASVVDAGSPAVTGFHYVLARDAPGSEPTVDLAARAPLPTPRPVVGVILTHGQHEYGARRRHARVAEVVTDWLSGRDCARLELETRLDVHDWRLSATPAQLEAVLSRLDMVVTDRLHGLVLALRAGVPVVAVDPAEGGAKVTAQARACGWPALVPAERLDASALNHWWDWCANSGRALAQKVGARFRRGAMPDGADGLLQALADGVPQAAGSSSRRTNERWS
ncbi:polysaccharide pyruvyl transferase family protein [Streptomyces sp. NBC_00457]|uniref:polysaccharide pyruvyl transferase family protein n=1 Tax=Streptomyces sp. NBC_00457 TaxID=2975748 RepID=UPI002E21716A